MKALWDTLARHAPRRLCGKFRRPGAAAADRPSSPATRCWSKAPSAAKMSVIVEALKARQGMMLYYLSLLTHTDQLAFFRLFRYLTFRSGAAVMTALADRLCHQSHR